MIDLVANAVGATAEVTTVPIPIDCVDGFTEAYYARPERFLDGVVRRSQSAWGFVTAEEERRTVERLRADLESGEWDAHYGYLRRQPTFQGSLRLIVGSI